MQRWHSLQDSRKWYLLTFPFANQHTTLWLCVLLSIYLVNTTPQNNPIFVQISIHYYTFASIYFVSSSLLPTHQPQCQLFETQQHCCCAVVLPVLCLVTLVNPLRISEGLSGCRDCLASCKQDYYVERGHETEIVSLRRIVNRASNEGSRRFHNQGGAECVTDPGQILTQGTHQYLLCD